MYGMITYKISNKGIPYGLRLAEYGTKKDCSDFSNQVGKSVLFYACEEWAEYAMLVRLG